MLIKTLASRVVSRSEEDLEALRFTSAVFSSCVAAFVLRYLGALRGRPSPRYRTLVRQLITDGGPNAYGVVDGLSATMWRSTSIGPIHRLAREIREAEGLWFDRYEELARHEGLPVRTTGYSHKGPRSGTITIAPEMYRQAANAGIWFLRALFAHRKSWREERRRWVLSRATFLEEHPDFARALTRWIAPFEQELTRLRSAPAPGREHGRRWNRWDRWYDWLVTYPEIAGWRDPSVRLSRPTAEEISRIERETRSSGKRTQLRLGLLLQKNPELDALEGLRLEWVEQYLRFRRPPRLRVPGRDMPAPAWVLPRLRGYRDFDPERGTVALQVLGPDPSGAIAPQWRTFEIRSDPRFSPIVRARRGLPRLDPEAAGRAAVQGPAVESLDQRTAGISGLSLIEQKGAPYLVAAVPTSLPRLRVTFGHNASAHVAADRLVDATKQPVRSARLLALHLRTEPLASYVVCEITRPEEAAEWTRQDLARGEVRPPSSPSFRQLLRDDGRRRRKTAQWGALPRGQEFDSGLAEHRRHSILQRQRSGAAAIVALARQHSVDMIVVDDYSAWRPTAAATREQNRFLALAGYRGLVDWIEHLARDVGIALGFSPAAKSTVLCSRCGLPGFRFRVRRKNAAREGVVRRADATDFGVPEYDPQGPEFRCPHCQRTENAGVNAARSHVLRLTRAKLPGLRFHPASGSWTLPDGTRRWTAERAAAHWFASLAATPRPASPPPA